MTDYLKQSKEFKSTSLTKKIQTFYQVDNKPLAMKLYENCNSKLLNFGYWTENTKKVLDAQINMVNLIGQKAELNKNTILLDIGFGTGQQTIILQKKFNLQKIYGLNLSFDQIQNAQPAMMKAGTHFNFINGDAVNIPIKSNSIDRIVVLEAAFHFSDRSSFYKEAFRVLKNNGIMVIFDILQSRKLFWPEKIFKNNFCNYWAIPPLISLELNRDYLIKENFKIIEEMNITSTIFHLWKPDWLKAFLKTLLKSKINCVPDFLINYLIAFSAFHINKNGGYYSIKVKKNDPLGGCHPYLFT